LTDSRYALRLQRACFPGQISRLTVASWLIHELVTFGRRIGEPADSIVETDLLVHQTSSATLYPEKESKRWAGLRNDDIHFRTHPNSWEVQAPSYDAPGGCGCTPSCVSLSRGTKFEEGATMLLLPSPFRCKVANPVWSFGQHIRTCKHGIRKGALSMENLYLFLLH
jgi:hypothetical protein